MAILLSEKYIAELKKGVNTPNVVVELHLDGGVRRYGYHARNVLPITLFRADGSYRAEGGLFAAGSDELPNVGACLKSISSLQNRLDPKKGFSTRGELTIVLSGRDNLTDLVANEYLKNRRAVMKDGFISSGFTYADYAPTFAGKITDWSRSGDELTLTISDDLVEASRKVPEESPTRTQFLEYRNMNPADIMTDLLLNRLGIDPSRVDETGFASERDKWLQSWRFDRTLTEPREANEYLNELQVESNSFIVHDGEKVSFKVFAPPVPGDTVEEWSDTNDLIEGSLECESGYRDHFYNRVVVYYDYDESGGDGTDNYESVAISADASSQDPSGWDGVSTKVIKSKWIRTRTFSQTGVVTGVRVYHVSRGNSVGAGTLSYSAAAKTITYAAPGDSAGVAVKLSRDGKYQVYSADRSKYVRVLATVADLPAGDCTGTVTVGELGGDVMAAALSGKILSRYRDPVTAVSFDIDINRVAYGALFIKPTDYKDITTGEAFEKGKGSWVRERVMLTSVRPDFSAHRVAIEAIGTRMYRKYGFIAPAGQPDYGASTEEEKEYCYIRDVSPQYHIW